MTELFATRADLLFIADPCASTSYLSAPPYVNCQKARPPSNQSGDLHPADIPSLPNASILVSVGATRACCRRGHT